MFRGKARVGEQTARAINGYAQCACGNIFEVDIQPTFE
jgi:hypothetical protein